MAAQLAPWSAVASAKRDTAFGLPSDSEDAEVNGDAFSMARFKIPTSMPPSPTQSQGGVALALATALQGDASRAMQA